MYSQQHYAISHFICLQKWIKSHSRRSSGIMEGLKLLSLSSAGAKSVERLNMTGYDSIFAASFPLQSSLSFAEPQLAFCVDFLFLRRGTEPEHHQRHKPLLCSVQRSLWCPGWCHNFNFSRGFSAVASVAVAALPGESGEWQIGGTPIMTQAKLRGLIHTLVL